MILSIFQSYVLTMADMKIAQGFFDQIMDLHNGYRTLTFPDLIIHICNVVKSFTAFANKLFVFKSLSLADRATLITHNGQLFAQYLLGRYFSAPSGLDQVTWLLDTNVPDRIDDMVSLLSVSFDDLNNHLHFIQDEDHVRIYRECIANIGTHFKHPHIYLGLVANMLVFNTTDTMELEEPRRISYIQVSYRGSH